MGNQITNASGLDGTTGWSGTGVAVDEAARGAPGRIAITATGQLDTDAAYAVEVSAGNLVEVFAFVWASAGAVTVQARFHNGAGVFSTAATVPILRVGSGSGRRGIGGNYDFAYWKGIAPTNGSVRLRVSSSSGAATVAVVKPFIDPDAVQGDPSAWMVGPHVNPDLDLPIWPEALGDPLIETRAVPTPMRKAFSTDTGIPNSRVVSPASWRSIDIPMVLDADQRDTLEVFVESQVEPFWFVEPGADRLCRARWAENGEPRAEWLSDVITRTTVTLTLEPA